MHTCVYIYIYIYIPGTGHMYDGLLLLHRAERERGHTLLYYTILYYTITITITII